MAQESQLRPSLPWRFVRPYAVAYSHAQPFSICIEAEQNPTCRKCGQASNAEVCILHINGQLF